MTHLERIGTLERLKEIARVINDEYRICRSATERINSPAGSLNSMPEVKRTNLAYLKVHEAGRIKNEKLYLSELKSFAEKEGLFPINGKPAECHSELER